MRMTVSKQDVFFLAVCCMSLILSVSHLTHLRAVSVIAMPASRRIIMVDAGHGGLDPGAGVGKMHEKTINLAIAEKLQAFLEMGDSYVLMTRVDDDALSQVKQTDMYRRKVIANTSGADIFVSIHQNYNRRASASGAQVYYFGSSSKSKRLAECVQAEIKNAELPTNKLGLLPNSDYYVLRKTSMPSVLIECGFMSNAGDRSRLTDEAFQEKMAWAIYLGILKYFENEPPDAAQDEHTMVTQ